MTSATVWQAAQSFFLAEQVSCLDRLQRRMFWEVWPGMGPADGAGSVAWLPSLAAAVRWESDQNLLMALAQIPLPKVVPPEALPWQTALVNAWKARKRTDAASAEVACTLALVRLEGGGKGRVVNGRGRGRSRTRPGRWMVGEAQRVRRLQNDWERTRRLAALSAWSPTPGGEEEAGVFKTRRCQ